MRNLLYTAGFTIRMMKIKTTHTLRFVVAQILQLTLCFVFLFSTLLHATETEQNNTSNNEIPSTPQSQKLSEHITNNEIIHISDGALLYGMEKIYTPVKESISHKDSTINIRASKKDKIFEAKEKSRPKIVVLPKHKFIPPINNHSFRLELTKVGFALSNLQVQMHAFVEKLSKLYYCQYHQKLFFFYKEELSYITAFTNNLGRAPPYHLIKS